MANRRPPDSARHTQPGIDDTLFTPVSAVHDSASRHVAGSATYLDDLPAWADEVHLAPVLSPHARARIVRVDTQVAQRSPGYVRTILATDIPGNPDIGPIVAGDPLLAGQTAEFAGQIVAIVVARTHREAVQAAESVAIEYQPLKPLLSAEDAFAAKHFVAPSHQMKRGDAAKAILRAPLQISGEMEIGGQDHFYLEGQVAAACPQEDGAMQVFSSTQNPTETQALVADVLGVDMHRVMVETRRMGGGFGGKETQSAQTACLAALAARLLNRPVRFRLSRSADMLSTGKRHGFSVRYTVGFDEDANLQGVKIVLLADCGYSADLSAAIVDRAMFHADNCYYLANVEITGYSCRTNKVSNTAFRGFGGPQGMLVAEQIIDAVACRLGLDSLAVRERNFYAKKNRNITHYGQRVRDNVIGELTRELVASSEYTKRRRAIQKFNRSSAPLVRGIAVTPVKFGISFTARHLNQAGALIHIYRDGSVHLNHGGTEMGQGLFTKVAQITAHELGIDLARVQVSATRTDKVPNTSPTAASAGTDLNGMAALNAARILRERLRRFAASQFKVALNSVRLVADEIQFGRRRIGFSELVNKAYLARVSLSATGFYKTPKIHYDRERAKGRPFFYFAYGVACSEVVVDTLTGEYRLLRADLLHDVGQSLNPAIDRGQVVGGFIQGVGWLTSEELVWDPRGRLLTDGPATYKIPAVGDAPVDLRAQLAPNTFNLENTVYRSKAVGEPPLMLAISVWAALKDAIRGVAEQRTDPRLDTPATPERVLRALDEARGHSWEGR